MCTTQGCYIRTMRTLASVHWWIDFKRAWMNICGNLLLQEPVHRFWIMLARWHVKLRLDSHRCQGHGDFARRYPNLHWGGFLESGHHEDKLSVQDVEGNAVTCSDMQCVLWGKVFCVFVILSPPGSKSTRSAHPTWRGLNESADRWAAWRELERFDVELHII